MVRAGTVLLLVGAGGLLGYGVYALVLVIYTEPDVPLVVKIASPIALIGVVLLVAAVARERLRVRKSERLQEVEN